MAVTGVPARGRGGGVRVFQVMEFRGEVMRLREREREKDSGPPGDAA
jgi:hypothetical protein